MTFIHDLDNSQDSQAIEEYMEQAKDLIKNPEQLADLTKAREAFNQALLTGTGTVGSLLTHKGLAGIKKKALDPLFKKSKAVMDDAREQVGNRIQAARESVQNEVSDLRGRVGAQISQQGVDGGAEATEVVPEATAQADVADSVLARSQARRLARQGIVSQMKSKFQAESQQFPDEVQDAAAAGPPSEAPSVTDPEPSGELAEALERRANAQEAVNTLAKAHDDGLNNGTLSNEELSQVRDKYREQAGELRTANKDVEDAYARARASAGEPETGAPEATAETTATTTGETVGTEVGEDVGETLAKAGATVATTDAELGGPENVFGDLISLGLGLGTVFAGLGAQKKAPTPTMIRPTVPDVQRGLAGY